MALGIVTVAPGDNSPPGNAREIIGTIVGPASYATNGELLTPQALGFASSIKFIDFERTTAGKDAAYDRVNGKLVFLTAAGAEETAAANLSAISYRFRALGV